MSEEIPSNSNGAYKPRSALGDVTNQFGKRGFSLISGDDLKKDEGFPFAKKECLRVDDLKKENFHKEIPECVLRPHSCSEIKEPCPPSVRQNDTSSTAVKSNTNGPHVIVDAEEDERTDSVAVTENKSKGNAENNLGNYDQTDASFDNLDLNKDECPDFSILHESQESRCGLERCTGQKVDGVSNTCTDLIKDCQCSFCTKAAYLWSDLHYQDIKGRIAVIKKSQKEASILVNQNSRDGAMGRSGQGNVEKFLNLESDLTGRWRSLFLHMEGIFVRESTQLETSLSALKELRDNCKTDSEDK